MKLNFKRFFPVLNILNITADAYGAKFLVWLFSGFDLMRTAVFCSLWKNKRNACRRRLTWNYLVGYCESDIYEKQATFMHSPIIHRLLFLSFLQHYHNANITIILFSVRETKNYKSLCWIRVMKTTELVKSISLLFFSCPQEINIYSISQSI